MSFLGRLFRRKPPASGDELSDLPTYWSWVSGDDPIAQFAGIGSIELVFRKHPEAIGGGEHRRSVVLLKSILGGRSRGLQVLAIQALALIKAVDALPELLEKTSDGDPRVREAAQKAMEKLREVAGQ